MAITFKLSKRLSELRWKVKIRDRERVEPPHVSVIRNRQTWRWNLRTGTFMDEEPDPSGVPDEVLAFLRAHKNDFVAAWDFMYPHNPVAGVK